MVEYLGKIRDACVIQWDEICVSVQVRQRLLVNSYALA